MNQFIGENKEVLSFCASVLGILLSLAFGGILSWRQRICLDYESRRDVAINILRDRFVQRTSNHYLDVADERKRQKTAVEEIYKRPQQQDLIRELARDLEAQNRVKRLFRGLALASQASFGFLWVAIIVVIIGIAILWFSLPFAVWVVWAVVLGLLLLGFVVSVSALWALDGRYFQLVHRIIEPEGE
jgi:hypothetical protein